LFKPLFDSLNQAQDALAIQVIVIDNASGDGSVEILKTRYPEITLIANKDNVGFGRANNQALEIARGRYVLLLNTDAFVSPDTLRKTIDYMDGDPTCGVLGVKLIGRDGALQPSCRYFPTPWNVFLTSSGLARFFPRTRLVDDLAWDHGTIRDCDWVPGCYYLIRREVLDQVGLFDGRYFMYSEEVDHCQAVRKAGWRVKFYPFTSVVHLGGESAKSVGQVTAGGRQLSKLQIESELLYFRKHFGLPGVLMSVALRMIAAAINAVKMLAARRDAAAVRAEARNVRVMLRSMLHTRLGATPTR
jgi:GT2 family glycosyltransferase